MHATPATPAWMDMLGGLIAQPSISSAVPALDQSNEGVIHLLAQWLEDLGFQVQLQELQPAPRKLNLVATLGADAADRGLILSGHTDTVPYDPDLWTTDPFTLTEADGRLYGLGTSDMKGFLALAVEASKAWTRTRLKHPLLILATADEETSMLGGRALGELDLPADASVLIGEPTGMTPAHLHKGIFMEGLRLTGRSGHSSDPALGNSALEGMHEAIAAILSWRTELQSRHQNFDFDVPTPTLNLGRIDGGDSPNRICAQCELHLDLRFLPGMPRDELRAQLHERVSQALSGAELKIEWLPLFEGVEAMHTPKNAAIVQACEAWTGRPSRSVAFATEGPFFNARNLPSVILGPGDIECAHQPNEHLRRDRIAPTLDLLHKLIGRFCAT